VFGLGRGLQRSGGSLRDALQGPHAAQLAPLFATASALASADGPAGPRVDAIRFLSLGPVDEALGVLPALLDARQSNAIQLAALQTLAALPDPRVGPLVIEHWKALSPTVRGEAMEVLFARADRMAALISALEKGAIAPADLDPARRKQLLGLADAELRRRAVALFGADTRVDRGKAIADYREALTLTGSMERGRSVFVKVCATCHRAEAQGVDVGPNLATVTGRTTEDLLIHILDPNREVAPIYVNYNVATTDGRVVSGIIADESANAVTLKRAEGVTEIVSRPLIDEITSTGLSLMPEGLEKGLEPQAMADLIAYLRGIQAGGRTAAGR
jgi:putative heme-binding domain-containing protein